MANDLINLRRLVLLTTTTLVAAIHPLTALARLSESEANALSAAGARYDSRSMKTSVTKKDNDRIITSNDQNSLSISTENKHNNENIDNEESENYYMHQNDIVVTGTSIRGIGSSAGADPVIITNEEIQQSGYATVHQALQTLPQVFSGGLSEHNKRSSESSQNFTASTSPDLRGLGAKATLILLNGRRLPSIGLNTTSVDISSLPVSVIERIEILPDGASSVYGSDAVAGVINIILKKKYDGAETRLRYGHTTSGNMPEVNISQSLGLSGERGAVLIAYDFYRRGNLYHDERIYSKTDDLRELGGEDRRIVAASPANIVDPLTLNIVFGIPQGQDGRSLSPNSLLPPELASLASVTAGTDLLPKQRKHNIYVNGNYSLFQSLDLFAEARFGDRKVVDNIQSPITFLTVDSGHPFYVDAYGDQRPLLLAYNFSEDFDQTKKKSNIKSYNAVIGAEYKINSDLFLRADGSYSEEKTNSRVENSLNNQNLIAALHYKDPDRVFNPFGDGSDNHPETLSFIAPPLTISTDFEIWEFNAILDGVLASGGIGAPRFAVGANFRHEFASSNSSNSAIGSKRFKRDIYAVFGELFWPILNEQHGIPIVNKFTLSISGRQDWYKDQPVQPIRSAEINQSTFNPKIGFNWELISGFEVHASYGTSFVTPSLANRIAETTLSALPFADPRSATGTSYTVFLTGTAPKLENEKADTWSVGVDISPPDLSNLRLSANYFYINFKNRIVANPLQTDILAREESFKNIIRRNPTSEDVLSLCALAENIDLPDVCLNPSLAEVIIDGRTLNQAQSVVEGIDGQASINIPVTDTGSLLIRAAASYIFNHKFRLTPTSPYSSNLNTYGNPIDLKSRITATWYNEGGLSATMIINYYDNYRNPLSNRSPNIGSWTTFDLSVSFDPPVLSDDSLIKNTTVTLSCINLFDNDPPFVDAFRGFDAANSNPIGRFISLTLSKKW
ncbi:TonB-dependent receptor domain-containing protein [Pedomonas mirosovicensis]|uniref:TonB-dependent receptor domain-containing protein n=1 Tax=Pedomonas mirosovicensis TaxID=2908641 RepID=UPI002169440B|nr:TonB-dependent receptor [Pedomonas mirosovicensis]MCH8686693.1 TonB-dependent receptor [Pedomonas mirosovicensis]